MSYESYVEGGIVVDKDIAASTPCHCVKTPKAEICWSPGVVGALDKFQRGEVGAPSGPLCTQKIYKESPKMEQHIVEFKQSVDACRGLGLPDRLACLQTHLKKEGVTKRENILEVL